LTVGGGTFSKGDLRMDFLIGVFDFGKSLENGVVFHGTAGEI